MPESDLKSSAARWCGEPLPAEPKLRERCLPSCTSSFTEFTPSFGFTISACGMVATRLTGVKSFTASYGRLFGLNAGLMPCVVVAPRRSVYPAGDDLATASEPIAPEAPALFSTTTGWPRLSESFAPTPRAMRSRAPPGANGEMRRIGLVGYGCAQAPCAMRRVRIKSRRISALQVRVAPLVERVVRVAHRLGARAAEHDLEVHRLQALVDVAVDHTRRAGDAFPRPELDIDALAALVLDEGGKVALQDEEDFLHFMSVRGVSLSRLDVHDGKREAARRDGMRVAVLAGAAGAYEAVLRALIALDFRVFERGPVGLAVAKARDVAARDFLERHADELGRARVTGDAGHSETSLRFIVP